ncbi:MAG TPA: hypothetical protein VJX66_22510 [Amycolatopsis sp.]|nr:hypothetical protein [Amycolatopsis sp.]
MELQIVIVVLGIVVLLIAGTAFSAWRADRATEREEAERENEA